MQCFFFFQAEDGIRDKLVTGVQTCALPIWLTASAISGSFHWLTFCIWRIPARNFHPSRALDFIFRGKRRFDLIMAARNPCNCVRRHLNNPFLPQSACLAASRWALLIPRGFMLGRLWYPATAVSQQIMVVTLLMVSSMNLLATVLPLSTALPQPCDGLRRRLFLPTRRRMTCSPISTTFHRAICIREVVA